MKHLLSFAFVLIALAVTCLANENVDKVSDEFIEAIKKEGGDCFKEVGMSEEDVKSLKNLRNENMESPEVKEKLVKFGCLMTCVYKNSGMMEGTKINTDKMLAKIEEEENDEEKRALLTKISLECVEEVKELDDECEIGLTLTVCTFKKLIS